MKIFSGANYFGKMSRDGRDVGEVKGGRSMGQTESQRLFNPLQHAIFAQNFEQMIQARAVGIAGDGEARGVDEHADFHAELSGGFLSNAVSRVRGVEGIQRGKGVAKFFEARFVFGDKNFFRIVGVVFKFIAEIKSRRRRASSLNSLNLPLQVSERGFDVGERKFYSCQFRAFAKAWTASS